MSQLQRIIVRMGKESEIPALKEAELGWDIDTFTMRVGNESNNPWKILTTGSTGVFDFSKAEVIFGKTNIENLNDLDLESLAGPPGILIRTATSGIFTSASIISSDGSVNVNGGDGQNGDIDITIDQESIENAVKPIIGDIAQMREDIDGLRNDVDDLDDKVEALINLSGVPANSTSLGTFSGNVIPDNVSVKSALQALEQAVLAVPIPVIDSLAIQTSDESSLVIKLESGSQLVIPLAQPEAIAGIINGADKKLLDDLREALSGGSFSGVTGWTAEDDRGVINLSDGNGVNVPLVTVELSGLMSPADKINLDNTSSSVNSLDLRLTTTEGKVDTLENVVEDFDERITNAQTQAANAEQNALEANNISANNTDQINLLKNRASALEVTTTSHSTAINNHEGRITTLEEAVAVGGGIFATQGSTVLFDDSFTGSLKETVIAASELIWPNVGLVEMQQTAFPTSGQAFITSNVIGVRQSGGSNFTVPLGRIAMGPAFSSNFIPAYGSYLFTVWQKTPTERYIYLFNRMSSVLPTNDSKISMPLYFVGSRLSTTSTNLRVTFNPGAGFTAGFTANIKFSKLLMRGPDIISGS